MKDLRKYFKYSDLLLASEIVAFAGNFPPCLSQKTILHATHTPYILYGAKVITLSLTAGCIFDTWLAIS